MTGKAIRFYCDICKKTLAIQFTEDQKKKLNSTADKRPYPLIYPHDGHYAIVFIDTDFVERGVTTTKLEFPKDL